MDLSNFLEFMPFASSNISGYQAELAKANFRLDLNLALELTEMSFFNKVWTWSLNEMFCSPSLTFTKRGCSVAYCA